MSEYLITYELTIEAEDEDAAIDGAETVLLTGEEHADDVGLVDWVRIGLNGVLTLGGNHEG